MTAGTLRKSLQSKSPGLRYERSQWSDGRPIVVGVDEVGKGAWAGPLTVGAVVVPKEKRLYKVRDSKMLTFRERELMYDRLVDWCDAWAIGHASYAECDELGMSAAQKLATKRALGGLGVTPDHVLVDGSWDFVGGGNTTTIVKGDQKSLSIAAASILAKVTRDRMMCDAARHYEGYDFEANKGYPCPRHRAFLQARGPCAIHRQSWAFMDELQWSGVRRIPPASERTQGTLFDA